MCLSAPGDSNVQPNVALSCDCLTSDHCWEATCQTQFSQIPQRGQRSGQRAETFLTVSLSNASSSSFLWLQKPPPPHQPKRETATSAEMLLKARVFPHVSHSFSDPSWWKSLGCRECSHCSKKPCDSKFGPLVAILTFWGSFVLEIQKFQASPQTSPNYKSCQMMVQIILK